MSLRTRMQIEIPTPCHEDWQNMTPCREGRHCNECQKTVVDFSFWSDADIYRFFLQRKESVCGRFHERQLKRPIQLPLRPPSRPYRLAVALGLTLIFTQSANVYAQDKVQKTTNAPNKKWPQIDPPALGQLHGRVCDTNKQPIWGATITVFRKGVDIGGAVSDTDGSFVINHLPSGICTVFVYFVNHQKWAKVITVGDEVVTIAPILHKRKKIQNSDRSPFVTGIVIPRSQCDNSEAP